MTGDLGLRHREPHVREEAPIAAVADVALPYRRTASARVAPTTSSPSSAPSWLSSAPVMRGFCIVKAIRIHEDGGPEVLRYEDVAGSRAGPGEVLVALRAAGLNHLDVWVRKGLPSVPKPRILGADGAGVVASLGEGVDSVRGRAIAS